MKTKEKEPIDELLNPIDEASRYVANAKEVLKEKGRLDPRTGNYSDPKYVRAAGNYLWLSVLIALEAVFHLKTAKKAKKGEDSRVTIKDYILAVSNRDQKLLSWVQSSYYILHLAMNYDGIPDKDLCQKGIQLADNIIKQCQKMIPND